MKLTITMELDNAAFEAGGAEEVGRILASVAGRIPDPLRPTSGGALSLHDANGNWCGKAEILSDEEAAKFDRMTDAADDLLSACEAAERLLADKSAKSRDRNSIRDVLRKAINKATVSPF